MKNLLADTRESNIMPFNDLAVGVYQNVSVFTLENILRLNSCILYLHINNIAPKGDCLFWKLIY
jgi:hypothetical protein